MGECWLSSLASTPSRGGVLEVTQHILCLCFLLTSLLIVPVKRKKKITYHQSSLYGTRSLLPAALETACPCGDPRPLTFLETVVKKRMLSAWLCMKPSKTGPVRWVWPVFWGNKFPSLSAGNEKSHSARRGRPSRECVQESCFPFISERLQHRGLPVVIVLCPPPHLHPILGYEAVHL